MYNKEIEIIDLTSLNALIIIKISYYYKSSFLLTSFFHSYLKNYEYFSMTKSKIYNISEFKLIKEGVFK